MTKDQSSYRQIFKATSLFGGVQIFNIFIAVIRSKFIAVLLGPTGMGIAGLLNATTAFIGALTSFGLATSAVKDVAAATATHNHERITKVITSFRRLVWCTGLCGTIITLVLAPWLSKLTFGNSNYTIAFIWLSITLLFSQLSNGQLVVLQGMRKLQHLAKANMVGAVAGLFISVPIYYFWHFDGIVPAIIISSLASLSISWFFSRKIPIKPVKVSLRATMSEGTNMLRMGFMINLSSLMVIGTSYIVRVFIGRHGGIDEVGLYNAGFTIISTYVGLIFTAMGTDYYPRLSATANDDAQTSLIVNQQAEIAILILGPILSIFLIFINWVVIILYSTKFAAVNGMMYYAAIGMYFKTVSWAIGFVLLAKSASVLFFFSEFFTNLYMLILNIMGYYLWGLDGMGISFLVGYFFYLVQISLIAKIKYNFSHTNEFYKIFILQLAIGILCLLCIKLLSKPWSYCTGMFLIGLSISFSFYELEKRIGFLRNWKNS